MSANITGNIQPQARVWQPPPTVTGHAGEALSSDFVFFATPPAEIGEVRSAHTTFKKGAKPRSEWTRRILTAIWSLVGILAATAVVIFGGGTSAENVLALSIGLFIGVISGVISWNVTGFKHRCNFVGTEGCAELVCKGVPENITAVKSLFFKDVGAISTSVTRHFQNNRYRHTSFQYSWYPPESDKPCYQIIDVHTANLETPPVGDAFNFARALETAWYAYLIPRSDAELAQNGHIKFFMGQKRWARVGPGFLEIVEKDGSLHRCEAADIGSAKLASGTFTLTRKDSQSRFFGLLSPSGTFDFDFGKMYNGRLFLYAFEKLVGLKLS